MKKINLSAFLVLFAILFSVNLANAEENFNPNYIISDSEMLNNDSMTIQEIQNFLERKGSYLASYRCINAYGSNKKASEIIYDAANNNYDCENVKLSDNPTENERKIKCKPMTTINPKAILVMLQKEQSLIADKTPKQSQLDWALGYGCPDGGGCNTYWKGFGKQVNSAALQFKDYMDNPHLYSYKAGNSYKFTNRYSTIKQGTIIVSISNSATAALYNYTPHVYNGNYNFYRFYNSYFTRSYFDGSLLQAEGEVGVWLLQNGKKRPFLSKTALTSRYDLNKIITVNPADLDNYEKGAPIRFPNYSVIMSPGGDIYLLVDDKKRKIADQEVFRKIGFNPEEIMNAGWEDINAYTTGKVLTANSAYPTGALLQNKKTGGVYWVEEGTKAPIWDKSFLQTKFKRKNIIPVSEEELNEYTTASPVLFENGELLKSPNSTAVYLIDQGKKRVFTSGEAFEELGYKWENVITTSSKVLYLYPEGDPIVKNNQ